MQWVMMSMQVTRQLGPPAQAAPTATPPQPQTPCVHSSPSRDMAVNTDTDLGGLEGLMMRTDSDAADPFSQSLHSSLDLHSLPQFSHSTPGQQGSGQGSAQQQGTSDSHLASSNTLLYPQQQQQAMHSHRTPSQQSGLQTQHTQQGGISPVPSQPQPIFFQGQWFTPAPVDFVPPPHLTPDPRQVGSHIPQHLAQPQQWPLQEQQHQQQMQYEQLQQRQYPQPQEQQQRQYEQLQQREYPQPQQQDQQQQMWQQRQQQRSGLPGQQEAHQSGAWSPDTQAGHFESPTFRDGAVKQLSPGPSGRTWSPTASAVTRLTLPSSQPATVQPKVCIIMMIVMITMCASQG